MPDYVCTQLSEPNQTNGSQTCQQWSELPANPFSELAQLTYSDAGALLSATVALFALAWAFKHLAFFTRRN